MTDAQPGESSSWWRRLATSPVPETTLLVFILVCVALFVTTLTGVFALDQQVGEALFFSILSIAAIWLAALRIAFPVVRNDGWPRFLRQKPQNPLVRIGSMVVQTMFIFAIVLPLVLGPSVFPGTLIVMILVGIVGIVALVLGSRRRNFAPHPRLARAIVLPLSVVTLLLGGWYVREAPTLFPAYSLGPTSLVEAIAWSPDGRAIAAVGQGAGLTIWSTKTQQAQRHLPCKSNASATLAWSPDGAYLAATCIYRSTTQDSNVTTVWDIATGNAVATLTSEQSFGSLSWAPSGNMLAMVTGGYEAPAIILYNVAAQREVASYRLKEAGNQVAWSPDGQYLGVIEFGDVRVLRATDGTTVRTLAAYQDGQFNESIVWSPDSREMSVGTLLYDAENKASGGPAWLLNVSEWSVVTGQRLSMVTELVSYAAGNPVVWSPNGQEFAIASGGTPSLVTVYSARTGHVLFTWRGQLAVGPLAWSPDGRAIASSGFNGRIAVWHPGTSAG